MNRTEDIRASETEHRISLHLEAIDKSLAARNVGIMERRSVINDVESQIRDMLAAKSPQPSTIADVDSVLAELDPPESYVATEASRSPEALGPSAASRRLSRAALAGAIWAPLGCFVFVAFFSFHVAVGGTPPPPSLLEKILLMTLLFLGIGAPFGATTLGIIAIHQICSSAGRLYGLALALIDALFYPLLLLDILLGFLIYHAYAIFANWHELGISAISHPNYGAADDNFALVVAISLAVSVIADYLIARRVWQGLHARESTLPAGGAALNA